MGIGHAQRDDGRTQPTEDPMRRGPQALARNSTAEQAPPTRGPAVRSAAPGVPGLVFSVQRTADPEQQDSLGGSPVSADVMSALSRRSGGVPLPDSVAQPIGEAMGADLSAVRVHADGEADRISRSMQATAFTYGQDVYFTQGTYSPGTSGGQRLLAHELAHVAQNRSAAQNRSPLQRSPRGSRPTIGLAADPAEAVADSMAASALGQLHRSAAAPAPATAEQVRRVAASAGLPVIRRDFDFVGKGVFAEPINFDADVVQAITRSKTFAADITKAKLAISALITKDVRAAGLAELKQIEKFVSTWEGTKVPLAQRKEVVDQVALTTVRLSEIAEDYTAKDTTAKQVEAQRIVAQERKEKQEKERLAKAQLKEKAAQEELAQQAERRDLAATEKVASNRSTLDKREVLPVAEKVAQDQAQSETAAAEKALVSDNSRMLKMTSSKAGKANLAKELKEGLAELEAQRTESTNRSMGVLANFTTTAAARALGAADLTWVIQTAGVDPRRARSLAEVINVSGEDRSVVNGLAGLIGEDLTATAANCVALFTKDVPVQSVLSGAKEMTKSATVKAYVNSAGAKLIPGYLALANIEAPEDLKEALAFDLQYPGTAYTTDVARRLLVGLAPKTWKRQAISWLIAREAAPEFPGLVALFIDPAVTIDELRSVFTAAKGVYTDTETLGLCQRHIAALAVLATKVPDGQPGCPDYTDRVMATRDRPGFGEPHQLAALRAVALLEADSDKATVTIGKDPVNFGRGPDNQYRAKNEETDAKTGFVIITFTDLAGDFEIHTHWGQNEDGRIYSMHLEHAGSNGMEIHTKKAFRPLVDKVVALHIAHYDEPIGGEFYA